jgi:hypothetical protein
LHVNISEGVGRRMAKKYALLLIPIIALVILVANFSAASVSASLSFVPQVDCVVDKTPYAALTVKITFENTGTSNGSWSVNIAFEGNSWSWKGTPQTLTLAPGNTKTLVWNGAVPGNAPINSMARLVVYYDDSFEPLDWWIHVVSSAELTITSSTVE